MISEKGQAYCFVCDGPLFSYHIQGSFFSVEVNVMATKIEHYSLLMRKKIT